MTLLLYKWILLIGNVAHELAYKRINSAQQLFGNTSDVLLSRNSEIGPLSKKFKSLKVFLDILRIAERLGTS